MWGAPIERSVALTLRLVLFLLKPRVSLGMDIEASHQASTISKPRWWAPIRAKQLSVALPSLFVPWLGKRSPVATNRTSCSPCHEAILLTWSGWHKTQWLLPFSTVSYVRSMTTYFCHLAAYCTALYVVWRPCQLCRWVCHMSMVYACSWFSKCSTVNVLVVCA